MTYGIRVINDNGGSLVDNERPVYTNYQTGTLSAWWSDAWYTGGLYNGTTNGPVDAWGVGEEYYYYDLGSTYRNVYYLDSNSAYTGTGLNTNPIIMPSTPFDDITSFEQLKTEVDDTLLFVKLPVGNKCMFRVDFSIKDAFYFQGVVADFRSVSYALIKRRDLLPNPTGYNLAVYNSAGDCVYDAASAVGYISYANSNQLYNTTVNHNPDDLWVSVPFSRRSFFDKDVSGATTGIVRWLSINRISNSSVLVSQTHQESTSYSHRYDFRPYYDSCGIPLLIGNFDNVQT